MKKHTASLCALVVALIISSCGGTESSDPLFTVGGAVSGLSGTLVLQNTGDNVLNVTADGPFTFSSGMAPGSSYAVTVSSHPSGQTCIVSNGAGTVLISNITNINVNCSARGGLDTAFNSPNGFVVQDRSAGGTGDDSGNAIAIDSQGRMLVTGSSRNSANNRDMVVWRFNADGTLDTTLNGTGILMHDSAAGGSGDDSGNAIAVDSSGRILVTGSSTNSGGDTDMVVWRFNADGTLDNTLNGNGILVHDSAAGGTGDDSGNAIAIDSSGRIVVAGSSTNSALDTDMVVWRFNPNGTDDTDFNKSSVGGIVVRVNTAGGTGDDSGNAIAIDSSGRILVAGSSTNGAGNRDMVAWRFKADGSLDTAFNSSGVFVHHNAAGGAGDDSGNAIAIDSGRILVAGSSVNRAVNTDMVAWRLTSTGTLDTAFNASGIVINNGAAGSNGHDVGNSVVVDSQGRILVTGNSTNSSGNTDMVVWRFNANGTLDSTFGAYGITLHSNAAGGAGDDTGNGVAVDPEGRIVVAGASTNSAANADMVIWRLFP